MISTSFQKLLAGLALTGGFLLPERGVAQRLANRYAIDYLRGAGTYTLANGTSSQGNLQFETRGKSVLHVDRKQKIVATDVASFTIDGRTLVPQGSFDFQFGFHEYSAEHAFIEYADTTGALQLALYHTAEPTGDMTTYFASYLLRAKGNQRFVVGPNNNKKWKKPERQQMAAFLAPWPALQQAVASGEATFENLPDYVRRANRSAQ